MKTYSFGHEPFISEVIHPCANLPGLPIVENVSTKGPSTYLHAGASKIGWPADHTVDDTFEVPPLDCNALKPGWLDRDVEAASDQVEAWNEPPPKLNALVEGSCTPEPVQHDCSELEARSAFYDSLMNEHCTPEYKAEFGPDGSARLLYVNSKTIAHFDTFADAKLAAQALNEHKGY